MLSSVGGDVCLIAVGGHAGDLVGTRAGAEDLPFGHWVEVVSLSPGEGCV